MADRIKGITVQIGGDTTGLNKALSGTNKEIKDTQTQLKDVNRLLKLDPTNTKLLEQRQRLLGNAVSETKTKLSALKEAEKQVQQQFAEGKVSQQQYDALQREISVTEQELKKLEKEAGTSNVAISKIGETSEKISSKTELVANATKGLSTAAEGVLAVAGGLSIEFEDSFAKVKTLLNTGETDMDAYKESIIKASNETGVAVGEYADAVYSAISASVDQKDAVAFTEDAIKLAKGGLTDATKSVDVLTTAINGYGLSVEDASKISDQLITTQNLGKTTVDELASSMGKVIPIASSANFGFEELAASYAVMTKNGVATAESGTYLKSMLNELTKSGSETDNALRELTGKGFAELKEGGTSTSEILNMLSGYAEKNGKTLKDMFGSVEGGSAALMLARENGEEFNEVLAQMQDSAGATQKAYDEMTGTAGAKIKNSLNELKNTGIELGDTLSPLIEDVVGGIQEVASWLSGLDEGQLKMIGTILLVVAAISPLLSIISKVSRAVSDITDVVLPALSSAISFIASNPIVLVIAAIVGLVALIATKGDEIQGILQKVDDFLQNIFAKDWTEQFGVFGNVLNSFFATLKGIWDSIKQVFDGIIDFIRGVFTGDWERAWKGVQEIFGGIFNGLIAIAKIPINGIIGLLDMAIDGLNFLIRGINKISFNVPSWVPLLGGKTFGFNIPNIPKIPYLAKGGILSSGSAVVGDAGPELLTVMGNRAMVQPLTSQTSNTTNLGGVSVYVYGAPGQDVRELAEIIMDEVQSATSRKAATFA